MDATQVFAGGEYLLPCRRSASYRRLRRRCELGPVHPARDAVQWGVTSKKNTGPHGPVFFLEAPPRFELGREGFADLCLTTWLWRHK